MKQKIIPLVSVLVGIIAFALTHQFLKAERRKLDAERKAIYAGARKVEVVAAARDIPGGTRIKPEDIMPVEVFETAISDRTVVKSDGRWLLGKKVLFPIKANRPVMWSDLEGGAAGVLSLAGIVQEGMRAVALPIGGASAVSGLILPNDRVDVLGTFSFPSKTVQGQMETVTLTVLQDVTVLATGTQMAQQLASRGGAQKAGGYNAVTLEVTPREAELLVFAQQMRGSLSLTLRNPEDVSFENELPDIDFKYLEGKLKDLNLFRQKNIRHKRNL